VLAETETKKTIIFRQDLQESRIFLPFQKKGLKESDGIRHRHLPYLIATVFGLKNV
jgi:hypothetical protein